jgi:hypothetical protein
MESYSLGFQDCIWKLFTYIGELISLINEFPCSFASVYKFILFTLYGLKCDSFLYQKQEIWITLKVLCLQAMFNIYSKEEIKMQILKLVSSWKTKVSPLVPLLITFLLSRCRRETIVDYFNITVIQCGNISVATHIRLEAPRDIPQFPQNIHGYYIY